MPDPLPLAPPPSVPLREAPQGLSTPLGPGEILAYGPGSSLAAYTDKVSKGVYIIPGPAELAQRFPGYPIVELEDWTPADGWPAPGTASIVQGPSGDPALIGVNLEILLFGQWDQAPAPAPAAVPWWVWLAAAGAVYLVVRK